MTFQSCSPLAVSIQAVPYLPHPPRPAPRPGPLATQVSARAPPPHSTLRGILVATVLLGLLHSLSVILTPCPLCPARTHPTHATTHTFVIRVRHYLVISRRHLSLKKSYKDKLNIQNNNTISTTGICSERGAKACLGAITALSIHQRINNV